MVKTVMIQLMEAMVLMKSMAELVMISYMEMMAMI